MCVRELLGVVEHHLEARRRAVRRLGMPCVNGLRAINIVAEMADADVIQYLKAFHFLTGGVPGSQTCIAPTRFLSRSLHVLLQLGYFSTVTVTVTSGADRVD